MKHIYRLAIIAALAAKFALLSGCERSEEAEVDSRGEATLDTMRESTGKLLDDTRSALDSAAANAREIGERSEEALDAAGETISERSEETIGTARDIVVEMSDKGSDAAKDMADKAKTVYSSAEDRARQLLDEGKRKTDEN